MLPELIAYLALLPAGFLCLAPVGHQLKHSFCRTVLSMLALFAILSSIFAFISWKYALSVNALLPVLLLGFFAGFQLILKMPVCKTLSVFFGVCTLMAILENISCWIEASRHPDLGGNIITLEAGLVQLGVNTVAVLLLFYPVRKYGSRVVDQLEIKRMWYMTLPLSFILTAQNLFAHPVKFETLFVNNVFRAFVTLILATMLIWLLHWITFYQTVTSFLDAARTEEKMRMLEMQESQYQAMQRYMEASARTRHDFRQNIRTIKNLYHKGDIEALGNYIDEYYEALPRSDMKQYCHNNALNALLNYYAGKSEENGIQASFRTDLPERLSVSDVDLCSIVGNILENAVTAVCALPEEKRRIMLTVLIRNDNRLYIVATNTFNGEVRERNGQYLSTRSKGGGIGLKSIQVLAEKYSGKADFSHTGEEFHSDVMLVLQQA